MPTLNNCVSQPDLSRGGLQDCAYGEISKKSIWKRDRSQSNLPGTVKNSGKKRLEPYHQQSVPLGSYEGSEIQIAEHAITPEVHTDEETPRPKMDLGMISVKSRGGIGHGLVVAKHMARRTNLQKLVRNKSHHNFKVSAGRIRKLNNRSAY